MATVFRRIYFRFSVIIRFVLVPAGATEPDGFSNATIWDEEAVGEWSFTTDTPSFIAVNSSASAQSGTKQIELVNSTTPTSFTRAMRLYF